MPQIKTATVLLRLLIKIAISVVGLLLAAAAIYSVSTDPWFQDGYFSAKLSGDLQVIPDNPILCIRSTLEALGLLLASCLVILPTPKIKMIEDNGTLKITIDV